MIAALLALAASALYGTADFLGGVASRRTAALVVAGVSQLGGLVTLLLLLPLLPPASGSIADYAWGALSGVAGSIAITLFYYALAAGRMSVEAPIAAAVGAAIPVFVGLALGERPGLLVYVGIMLVLGSIVLVSQEGSTESGHAHAIAIPEGHHPIVLAVAAGIFIGAFYTILGRISPAAGLQPLVLARFVSVGLLLGAARHTRSSLRLRPRMLAIVLTSGAIDIAANTCYLLATQRGMLSVVATLASLYPAATLLLARVVLAERLRKVQLAGLGMAALAITLIAGR